jgi:hypothetical protein
MRWWLRRVWRRGLGLECGVRRTFLWSVTVFKGRLGFRFAAASVVMKRETDVDQAWHLHLTFSENYWKVFCPQILGSPLHHHPTRREWENEFWPQIGTDGEGMGSRTDRLSPGGRFSPARRL